MSHPGPPNERVVPLTAWGGIGDRILVRVSGLLERYENTAVAGRLIAYVRAHISELTRFVITGASLQLLNLAFLYALRVWLRLPDPIAVTCMYVLGVLAHFPTQRWITYGAQHRPVAPQLRRYVLMLVWNFAIMQAVVGLGSRASISPYIAVMIATVLTMVSNFVIMTHIVFTKRNSVAETIAGALRQRGVKAGSVLVLADGPGLLRNLEPVPEFQFTRGSIENAASSDAFVGVAIAASRADLLEEVLAASAARLRPGIPLVLILPHARPDSREDVHLRLLRSGYDRVWIDSRRDTICASARRAMPARVRTCSIIIPVFNESDTFPVLMEAVLDKRLDHLGLEREILIVESNSTDGSRELVAGYASTPGVRILWQDRPQGKGHAVRAGLQAATGDVVLIQDADLEYDVKDYDALLEPLLQERAAFVLGSRHSGRRGMRQFTDQRWLGTLFNFGHVCFTGLINLLYGQTLRDPFTMYKVFRRDCLYGLPLECNRFDFDHELVIKLVLKGYRPLEIPVSYRSRSFKQGKKIRPVRDALTWVAADVRYRVRRLRPHLD